MRRSTFLLTAIFSLALASPLFAQRGDIAVGEPHPGSRNNDGRGYDRDRDDDIESWRSRYRFGGREHLTELANDVYEKANSVCWEMNNRYKHNREFDATYREAYKILQDAKHIRKLISEGYYRQRHTSDEIERDLKNLDRLFHHIEEDVADWRPTVAPRRRPGEPLNVRMDRLEESLHGLMVDYGTDSRFRDRVGRRNDGHRWEHREY